MNKTDLKYLVVGAGAIGGITAALLKKEGYYIEILCRDKDHAALISEKGIQVKGVRGDFSVRVPAYYSASDIKDKKDVILHATKATDMIDAARSVLPLLRENGFIVSMQNGLCEDELASVTGTQRVIGCVTGWGATMESRGVLDMTSEGDFILGYPGREPDEFLTIVAEALGSVAPSRITRNILGHLYSKLIINSCITSLGAICGLYLGEMLSMRKIRNIFIEIIREAVAVAERMKINIELFGDRLDFKEFIKGERFYDNLRRHLMIRIIGFKYRRLKSSSLQSLERGKLSEIDYLNGYIAKNGIKYDIDVPVNSSVTKMIHEIELKKRAITVENFKDPAFDRFN